MSVTVMEKCTKTHERPRETDTPVTVSVGENKEGDHAILNSVVGDTQVQIGCEETVAKELGLATEKFHGTIGEVNVDGEMLPLWLFAETTKECNGAFAVPANNTGGYMFRFAFISNALHNFCFSHKLKCNRK